MNEYVPTPQSQVSSNERSTAKKFTFSKMYSKDNKFKNKLIALLGVISVCLLISTIALAVDNKEKEKLLSSRSWVDSQFKFQPTAKVKIPQRLSNQVRPIHRCRLLDDSRFEHQDGETETMRQVTSLTEKIADISGHTGDSNVIDSFQYRLPKHIIPKNYKLLLWPNVGSNKTFDGDVKIHLEVTKSTKRIILHSNLLNVSSTSLKNNKINQNVKIISIEHTKDKREFIYINLEENIPVGHYELSMGYSGKLNALVGFYESTLRNGRTMVASKFQPTYARQAFPCFDEPDFKATYDISLVKPLNYVALSNMNEISKVKNDDGLTETVSFATSVPMSTYLACFVICDFGYKETKVNSNGIGNNFQLRTFAQKDQMHKIDFALDIGKRATEFYVKYYEVPFPLPKLDMIGIPDYVSGATEHWGLVTYRETSFLVDEVIASAQNKISVANTIVHELAHMWFGNLVTLKWWDDLWLNEGFATYMQTKSLNAIEPSWNMVDQFLTKTLHSVLITDAKLSSHPIVQTVDTPDQITAIFDAISYSKGASVIRMLEGFMGEENFRRGVSDYLKKYQFGNTITSDLLSSLEPYFKENNPDLSLSYIMDTWTRQMGYPLLNVASTDESNTYVITQKRFLLDPDAVSPNDSQFKYRWFVPITYKTGRGVNKNIMWFPDSTESVKVKLVEGDHWIKINNNQVGYYRVNYTKPMWEKLIKLLKSKSSELTISDRSQLLDDVFALASAGVVAYDLALELSDYLVVEQDYVPWVTASSIFGKLSNRLLNTKAFNDLQLFLQQLVRPLYEKQTWEKTEIGIIEGLLRTKILSLAVRSELPEAVAKVRELFSCWLEGSIGDIEPELRDIVYYYGMKSASQSEWDKLWKKYLSEADVQEKAKLRSALSAPSDAAILKRYLTLSWDENNIRSQDYLNVIQQISDNPAGEILVWSDVRAHWPRLVDRFTLNSRYLGYLIPSITKSFNTDDRLKEMEAFFAEYPEAGAGETHRRNALETVRDNVRWANTRRPPLAAWLAALRNI